MRSFNAGRRTRTLAEIEQEEQAMFQKAVNQWRSLKKPTSQKAPTPLPKVLPPLESAPVPYAATVTRNNTQSTTVSCTMSDDPQLNSTSENNSFISQVEKNIKLHLAPEEPKSHSIAIGSDSDPIDPTHTSSSPVKKPAPSSNACGSSVSTSRFACYHCYKLFDKLIDPVDTSKASSKHFCSPCCENEFTESQTIYQKNIVLQTKQKREELMQQINQAKDIVEQATELRKKLDETTTSNPSSDDPNHTHYHSSIFDQLDQLVKTTIQPPKSHL